MLNAYSQKYPINIHFPVNVPSDLTFGHKQFTWPEMQLILAVARLEIAVLSTQKYGWYAHKSKC